MAGISPSIVNTPTNLGNCFETYGISPSILEGIESVSGTSLFKDARIVFLGDAHHNDKRQDLLRQLFIDKVIQENDIVLIEAANFSEVISQKKFATTCRIKKKVIVHGWDDMESHEMIGRLVEKLMPLAAEFYKVKGKSPKEAIQAGMELDKKTVAISKEKELLNSKRNASLVKAVNEILPKLSEKQKVFILAGRAHFIPEVIDQFSNEKYVKIMFKITPGFDRSLSANFSFFQETIRMDHETTSAVKSFVQECDAQKKASEIFLETHSATAGKLKKPECKQTPTLTLKMPDGSVDQMGLSWFRDPKAVQVGSKVKVSPDMRETLLLIPRMASFLANLEQEYEVLEIITH
jgi:hypothetical protein